jgi:hypothetical protein
MGVAYSRNWLLGPRGRPSPSLLDRTLSEPAGVPTSVIIHRCFSLNFTASLFSVPPIFTSSCSACIFGIASVCIPTGAALSHPGRNFIPLLLRASCTPSVLKSSLSIHSFSLFENLILAWADASFQLVSALPIRLSQGNYM